MKLPLLVILDFETNSTLVMTLEVSDGTNTTTEEITINVINDDEPATIAATLSATSFAENSAVGASIASSMRPILRAVR